MWALQVREARAARRRHIPIVLALPDSLSLLVADPRGARSLELAGRRGHFLEINIVKWNQILELYSKGDPSITEEIFDLAGGPDSRTKPRDLYDLPEEEIGLTESRNTSAEACQENEEMTDVPNSNVTEDDVNRTLNNPVADGEQVEAYPINPGDDDVMKKSRI
ncbi:hypothetical protein E2562_028327 [Oryza meyeriana var. granulata]|uniref:Uncharacterized protein n=1 Tax=Oryza meyeriana var. granulata TaxID=110450 RepID=A0A6G1FD39_9ORYZ|nr:hypothetical protein E2562_028327 [Oryza meyeriana var. granulata]